MLKASVLEFARKQVAEQREIRSNLLAQISPSPASLIAAVFDDIIPLPSSVIIDMGMGDGRWLIAALERFTDERILAFGIEIDPARIQLTRKLIAEHHRPLSIEIVASDLLLVDVSMANIVIAYLSREGNKVLSAKLDKELQTGAIVVAVGFQFVAPQWSGRVTKSYKCSITGLPAYVYKM